MARPHRRGSSLAHGHLANRQILAAFSQPFLRLPLRQSPHIHLGNALQMDWNDLLLATECSYIMGNPPFIGKKEQSTTQKQDVKRVFHGWDKSGTLDYVTCWYVRASQYLSGNTAIEGAFVSTNSVTQGEQVGALWPRLLQDGLHINFAYRTFEWTSEARGKAHVHCVIIGFSLAEWPEKLLFDYPTIRSEPILVKVGHINPYLIDASDRVLLNRRIPLSGKPIQYGSFALDDGYLTINSTEYADIVREDPSARPYLKPFLGARELIRGEERWCVWLENVTPRQLNQFVSLKQRVEAVQKWRLSSGRRTTERLAATPGKFAEIRQPKEQYLALPTVSSIRRTYIPLALLPPTTIASNQIYVLPGATVYDFGLLTSAMHMSWVRVVCGRSKSDFRYSAGIVYNNYPWPESPTAAQRTAVEREAQAILDARALFPDSNLATLYDPVLMPPKLVKAHGRLDRAVERCYRPQPFTSDRERVEFLFSLYEKLTAPLLPSANEKKYRRTSKNGPPLQF